VWKLDRLGRSLRDLITMLDDLKQRGVRFHSLTEAIDTTTTTGRAMWQMIGVLAELERSLISERTRAGVKAAKGRGVKFGRKPKAHPPANRSRPQAHRAGRGRGRRGRHAKRVEGDHLPGDCIVQGGKGVQFSHQTGVSQDPLLRRQGSDRAYSG